MRDRSRTGSDALPSSLRERQAGEALWWEAIPAEPRQNTFGAYPLGSVRIFSDDGREEFVDVPACVARTLMRQAKEDEELSLGARTGAPSSRAEIYRTINRATTATAKERVLGLLERRDYSAKEVRERLVSEGFSCELASKVVEKAQAVGIVSDERFAQAFVRSKLDAGWGMGRIERTLQQKGVDPAALKGLPFDIADPEDELNRALEVASRKRVSEPHAYQKMVRFLMGRGFGCALAKKAAARALAEDG